MASPVAAAPAEIAVPATRLADALIALSRQTGISVGATGPLPRIRTPAVRGRMEPQAALDRLFRSSAWRAVRVGPRVWRIEPVPPPQRRPAVVALAKVTAAPERTVDIVVTATKRAERLADLPLSINIVSPASIGLHGAERGTAAALTETEGAFLTNLGPGRDRIFLRGVADSPFNGPTQSTVGLFLNDARVSYATPDPDLRLVDIDRVEVLRGPQGTLYGTGSLGGIVRIVTTRPVLGTWSGKVAAEGATVAHGGGGGAAEGVLNAPLVGDTLAMRVVAYGETMPGWIDDTARAVRNVNRVQRYGGRIALRWAIDPDWTVDASATGQWINAQDSQYATAGLTRATAIAEPHDNDFLAVQTDIRGPVGELDFQSSSAVVTHEVGSIFDASAVADARGLSPPLRYDETRGMTLLSQELRLSDPAARRPWVAGVSLLDVDNRSTGRFVPSRGSGQGAAQESGQLVRDQNDQSTEAAIFGEATQALARQIELTLGVRAFVSQQHSEVDVLRERRRTKIGVTPSATLAWRSGVGDDVWLRYASAIRPGGLNPAAQAEATRETFRSDELKSVELGWRTAVLRDRLAVTGALFALRWENLQSDLIGVDGLVSTINAGMARNFGLELGATLTLAPFTISAGVTAQNARLADDGPYTAEGDRRLPVVPDLSGRLRIRWTGQIGGWLADADLGGRYIGRSRLSFDPDLRRSMGNYAVADAGVGIARSGWRTRVAIENLFDGRGDSFAFGNPFSIRTTMQRTPVRPRTLSIRLSRDF